MVTSKKLAVAAAAALASIAALTAAAPASAQDGWGYRPWSGYDAPAYGRPARDLFERERRIDQWLRNSQDEQRIDYWRAARLKRELDGIRGWTFREAREHRGFLPGDDFNRISARLDDLAGRIRDAQYQG
jgi:hypothetical protein